MDTLACRLCTNKLHQLQLQTLEYTPLPEHNEAKLSCLYEQYDSQGNEMFPSNEKHVQLSVHYVLEPYIEMKTLPQAKVQFTVV
jgi:hypothetical protein